jgi:acetoin utilization deacetylase AcuC-like enzyme
MQSVQQSSWADRIVRLEPREATTEEIALVHSPRYVEAMRHLCEAGGEYLAQMEANVGRGTWQAAMRAGGAGLTLADRIITNYELRITNAESRQPLAVSRQPSAVSNQPSTINIGFAPVRPPGHHAIHERPMGFCVFNNIAITAQYLLQKHGLERIAILDFDVHHGNGTEAAFWYDSRVLFGSIHRDNLYPYDKGRREDIGEGAGRGYTVNIPLPEGSGDEEYLNALRSEWLPKVKEFDPQFVLVSAGFDAHYLDPLGGMNLTADGYEGLAEITLEMAAGAAQGRIIALLEGGYSLDGLTDGVTAYLGRLSA